MPILSLCSGYEGLGMAVEPLTGERVAYVAEVDEAAAKVLSHRFPDAPNIGDITTYDWTELEGLVDIITAGFPCQDISNAGRGAGIYGSRSGIWKNVAEAVRVLRPRYVFLENVSAIRGKGLDVVLRDLASMGYDAQWVSVRASAVGAPHHRDRWFCLATPSYPGHGDVSERAWPAGREGGERESVRSITGCRGEVTSSRRTFSEDTYSTARIERGCAAPREEEGGGMAQPSMTKSASFFPTPTAADGKGGPGTSPNRKGGENLRTAVTRLPIGGEITFLQFDAGKT